MLICHINALHNFLTVRLPHLLIIGPTFEVIYGAILSLMALTNVKLDLVPVEPIPICIVVKLGLFDDSNAEVCLIIDDILEVYRANVLILHVVQPVKFIYRLSVIVSQHVLFDVLVHIYLLHHIEAENGQLEDMDRHEMLNHLLV